MPVFQAGTMSTYQASFGPLNTAHFAPLAFSTACLVPCFPPRSAFRRGLLLLQVLFTISAFLAPPPSNVSNTAMLYTPGVLNGVMAARYIDRIYLRTPEQAFWRLVKSPRSKFNGGPQLQKKEPSTAQLVKEDSNSLSPFQKLLWTFELLTVGRGVGWNWRVAGIPTQTTQLSRAQFLRRCAVEWIAMYAGLHLVNIVCFAMLTSFRSICTPWLRSMLMLLTSNPIFMFMFIFLGWTMTVYSHFALLSLPLAMICVGLRVGPTAWQELEAWPPNFGSYKEAYSIRRLWGYTWHQQMRRTASAPGIYLLSLLPWSLQKSRALLPRLLKRYFLLLATFFTSALIHAAGSYNVTRALNLPLSDGGEIMYFTLQAIGIMAEDLAVWINKVDCRSRASNGLWKHVGYITTASFYIFTRSKYKAGPLAAAHGIQDARGELFAAVELVRRGAIAVPGNFVAAIMNKVFA